MGRFAWCRPRVAWSLSMSEPSPDDDEQVADDKLSEKLIMSP